MIYGAWLYYRGFFPLCLDPQDKNTNEDNSPKEMLYNQYHHEKYTFSEIKAQGVDKFVMKGVPGEEPLENFRELNPFYHCLDNVFQDIATKQPGRAAPDTKAVEGQHKYALSVSQTPGVCEKANFRRFVIDTRNSFRYYYNDDTIF
jgi:hypothetical protein